MYAEPSGGKSRDPESKSRRAQVEASFPSLSAAQYPSLSQPEYAQPTVASAGAAGPAAKTAAAVAPAAQGGNVSGGSSPARSIEARIEAAKAARRTASAPPTSPGKMQHVRTGGGAAALANKPLPQSLQGIFERAAKRRSRLRKSAMDFPINRSFVGRLKRYGPAKVYQLKGYTTVEKVKRKRRRERMRHERAKWIIRILVLLLIVILLLTYRPLAALRGILHDIGY